MDFTDGALRSIAKNALQRKTGARGLRSILVCELTPFRRLTHRFDFFQERILLEPMFDIPESDIIGVRVDEEAIKTKQNPEYIRSRPVAAPSTATDDQQQQTNVPASMANTSDIDNEAKVTLPTG